MAVAEPGDMALPQASDLALADLSGPSVDLAMPTTSTSFQNDVHKVTFDGTTITISA